MNFIIDLIKVNATGLVLLASWAAFCFVWVLVENWKNKREKAKSEKDR